PYSRNKGGTHTPIQRSGSKLEVLPPEVQTIIYSELSPRETHSAGSDGRRSHSELLGSKAPPFQRSSSEGRLTPNQGDPLVRKQVVLPTVKRDYERHGTPIGEAHVMTPADVTDYNNSAIGTDSNSSYSEETDQTLDGLQGAVGGGQRSKVEIEMESLINRLKIDDSSRFKERDKDLKTHTPVLNRSPEDPYYLSHTPSTQPSTETLPSATTSEGSIQGTSSGISAGDNDVRAKEELSSSSEEEEDEEDTEEEKAPFELIGEFLESVMDADYEAADKLCKMILLYEPDNKECKQFQPLIEEMLKREREEELWGSDDDSMIVMRMRMTMRVMIARATVMKKQNHRRKNLPMKAPQRLMKKRVKGDQV
ncbi:putative glutamate-rich protein 2 isoform X1, partial [Apostichopus japonicus]